MSKIIEDKLGRKIAAVRKLNGITKFSFCILWFDLGRVDLALNHRIKYSENDEIDRMSVSFDHKIVKESIDMCFFSDLLFDNKQKQLMYFLVD